MKEKGSGGRSYLMAAAVGGVCGGIAAILATKELPKLLSEMKEHMHEMCEDKCACAPDEVSEGSEDTAEAAEQCCN